MMITRKVTLAFLPPLLLSVASLAAREDGPESPVANVDFVRDVKPILDARCIECHGAAMHKGRLRLDQRSSASKEIVPGKSAESELVKRVTSTDSDERMPKKGAPLDAKQIETLRAWIDEGATWPEVADSKEASATHWAYVPPKNAPIPALRGARGVTSPIDAFVRARLEKEGIRPSPEADAVTLIRRASLDITGLPPTPAEIDAFLVDAKADRSGLDAAYRRLVDRLLAAPAYGERMAQWWLDLARYADTNGYEKDERRTMWPWRDWVIRAFNANEPFDAFTIDQLAGDLLPNATLDQKIATGFHRNTLVNQEGGTDPEEFRNAAVIDRANTTATVWLGSTMGCAQCHDHKFDPFSQKDYYSLFAFFDSTKDAGNSLEPQVRAPTAEEAQQEETLVARSAVLQAKLEGDDPKLDAAERAWCEAVSEALPPPTKWTPLAISKVSAESRSPLTTLSDGSVLEGGTSAPEKDAFLLEGSCAVSRIVALRLDALEDPSLPTSGPGRSPNGNFVVTDFAVEVVRGDENAPRIEKVAFVAADADFEQSSGRFRVAEAIDSDPASGWAILEDDGTTRAHRAVFVPEHPIALDAAAKLRVTIACKSPFAGHVLGRFMVSATDDAEVARWIAPPTLEPWRSIGPFAAKSQGAAKSQAEAFDTVFPPENEIVAQTPLSARYEAGGPAWEPKPDWRDGDEHALACENCAVYLVRRVMCDDAMRLRVFVGADDAFKLWVNGALVRAEPIMKGTAVDQHSLEIDLVGGDNQIALKVVNGGGPGAFFFQADRKTRDRMPDAVIAALRKDPPARTAVERAQIRRHWRANFSDESRAVGTELDAVKSELAALRARIAKTPVLEELAMPRTAHVLVKGNFLVVGDVVVPDVPPAIGALHSDPSGAPRNRLGLARWLVSPDNPITARVIVNRVWERFFGRGIVPTVDDFGTRGDPPSHPELLDWLAIDFVKSGWDVKQLVRTIVTSATYRQSSNAVADLLERDPDNALLARAPRNRLEVETVRDVALAAAGLLNPKIGGPSVMPPQPDGVWAPVYSDDAWKTATDGDRFRRGLYTFWRRSSPYATYMLFDAPSRELACTRRPRTNTPLQALALLNDPAFVECARGLAQRALKEGGDGDAARIAYAFRLCTARRPSKDENDVLMRLLSEQRQHLATHEDAAATSGRHAELDAWMSVANVLLNLDETVTRN
jgi:hypothetical protein